MSGTSYGTENLIEKREHSTFKNRNKNEFSTGKDVGLFHHWGKVHPRNSSSTPLRVDRLWTEAWGQKARVLLKAYGGCQLRRCFVMLTCVTLLWKEWNCISFPQFFLDNSSVTYSYQVMAERTQRKSTKLSSSIFRAWAHSENKISLQIFSTRHVSLYLRQVYMCIYMCVSLSYIYARLHALVPPCNNHLNAVLLLNDSSIHCFKSKFTINYASVCKFKLKEGL